MPDRKDIAWKRVVVEGLTILLSILLAFSIDAWWADSVDRQEEKRLLISLREELVANDSTFKQKIVFRDAIADAAFDILEIAEGVQPVPEPTELDRLMGSLNWWDSETPSVGALKTVSQSGKLSLITDESLRAEIATIEAVYDGLQAVNLQTYDTFKEAWMPYLYRNGHISQLSNAQRSAPGIGGGEQPELPLLKPIDHSVLLGDREFVGIVTNIYWDQNDVKGWLLRSIELLDSVVLQIDSHLD